MSAGGKRQPGILFPPKNRGGGSVAYTVPAVDPSENPFGHSGPTRLPYVVATLSLVGIALQEELSQDSQERTDVCFLLYTRSWK